MSLQALKSLLQREIVARFDGRHLNTDIPAFATGKSLATGEALAVYVWERLAGELPAGVGPRRGGVGGKPPLYSQKPRGARSNTPPQEKKTPPPARRGAPTARVGHSPHPQR